MHVVDESSRRRRGRHDRVDLFFPHANPRERDRIPRRMDAATRTRRLRDSMNAAHNARVRGEAFARGARAQPEYESTSWIKTTLMLDARRRGVARFAWPWCFVNVLSCAERARTRKVEKTLSVERN